MEKPGYIYRQDVSRVTPCAHSDSSAELLDLFIGGLCHVLRWLYMVRRLGSASVVAARSRSISVSTTHRDKIELLGPNPVVAHSRFRFSCSSDFVQNPD